MAQPKQFKLSSVNVNQHTKQIQQKTTKSYPELVFEETRLDYNPYALSSESEKAVKAPSISSLASTMKFGYKKKRSESFNIYIYKVLKQVHPDIGMSTKGMAVMNGFVQDTFDRIATEAGNIVKYNKKSTMGVRALKAACKLVLPGELAIHADNEGNKAIIEYVPHSLKL
eukprot:200368_1